MPQPGIGERSGIDQGTAATLAAMPSSVLVVTDRIAASPELIATIRARAERDEIQVRLLVPNPAPAEWHPTPPARPARAQEARSFPREPLPVPRNAAGVDIDGIASTRHDPMDAIE